jgi:nascent polypeptide-associated complex subunit alpha
MVKETADVIAEKTPKIQEITEDSDDEELDETAAANAVEAMASSLSRGEKKARKALGKLGLKHIPEITRVTIKRPKGVVFAIAQPDVWKSSNADTFIVFGEARVEDFAQQAQANAAQQFAPGAPGAMGAMGKAAEVDDDEPPKLEEIDDGEVVDETGIEPKDIELVMSQTSVSRAQAVKAIKANNNDIINAIMELSM